jgi:hypothetical protein
LQKEGELQNRVTCVWKEPGVPKQYRSAVSLHGHTSFSQESLFFIPIMTGCFPPLRRLIARLEARARSKSGISVDFSKGYWTPPLPPLAAFQLESEQIERDLDLFPLVSLSDHENIEGPALLRVVPGSQQIPLSLEWTVPYRGTVLHLGVHNLPAGQAEAIVRQLNSFTAAPNDDWLHALLDMLDRLPEVLLVLNHPLWDLMRIGAEQHLQAVSAFMAEFGIYLHALELNGLRSAEENHEVAQLARGWNQLVISGGDRHGCEASAVLNLTEAQTFGEFVQQVRKERRSHVLFMSQYREPIGLRLALSVFDVLRDYPDYSAGSRRWDERVFHPDRNGEYRPLAEMWTCPPALVRVFVRGVHLLDSEPVLHVLRIAMGLPQREPGLLLEGGQEVAP